MFWLWLVGNSSSHPLSWLIRSVHCEFEVTLLSLIVQVAHTKSNWLHVNGKWMKVKWHTQFKCALLKLVNCLGGCRGGSCVQVALYSLHQVRVDSCSLPNNLQWTRLSTRWCYVLSSCGWHSEYWVCCQLRLLLICLGWDSIQSLIYEFGFGMERNLPNIHVSPIRFP